MLLQDIYPHFAMFDERARTFLTGDVFAQRYKILRAKENTGSFYEEFDEYRYPIDLQQNASHDTRPIKVTYIDSDSTTMEVYCWKTRYEVYDWMQNKMIPVLDFSNMKCFAGLFPYTALLDSREYFTTRRLNQISLRMKAVDYINAEAEQQLINIPQTRLVDTPPPLKNHGTIPVFVAKLMKKQLIEDEELCPISMLPFSDEITATVTSCYHMFDTENIMQWVAKKNECPVCRQTIYCLITV